MNLDDIRKEIDAIDSELVSLVCKRMDCSRKVAEYKIKNGIAVFDKQRENLILDKIASRSGEYADALKRIYATMMEQSRAIQYNMVGGNIRDGFTKAISPDRVKTVACQGIAGAYSHLTAIKLYPNADIMFYETWADVCKAIDKGEAEYGILPVENSWAGSVHEVYDLLIDGNFYIAMCADAGICHNLIGVKGANKSDIKTVISHPQALAQCAEYLEKEGYGKEQTGNTAKAVRAVADANDKSFAAIGSVHAAKLYGLDIIQSGIASSRHNTTRFVSICKAPQMMDKPDKISVVLSIDNCSGTLYNLLASFASCGMNLSKIESRPIKGKNFEYLFYIDFEGNLNENCTLGVLTTMKKDLPYFKLLGNYPEHHITLE